MASLFTAPQFDGGNGIQPEDGLQLFFFIAGTSTPKDTFTTESLGTANSNPVISDANGVFPEIWMTEGDRYTIDLKDKNDNLAGFGAAALYIAGVTTGEGIEELAWLGLDTFLAGTKSITKAELTDQLYDQDFERDSNVIEVLITRLRKKLDPERKLGLIETLRGRGYRIPITENLDADG